MSKLDLFYPVKKPLRINQGFGVNPQVYAQFGINGHNGLDLYAQTADLVRATHDGIVVYAGMDNNEGVGVVIRTEKPYQYLDGEAYYKTIYWHLINDIPVKVGQQVKAGMVIGYADNTGFSTGSHLHFGLKPQAKGENDLTWWNIEQNNGYLGAIDPSPYWNNYYAEDAQKVIGIYEVWVAILKSAISFFKK